MWDWMSLWYKIFQNYLRRTNGFTIMELLVSLGILAGIALGASYFFSLQLKSTTKVNVDSNISQTVFAINQAISKVEGCEETFVKPGTVRPEGEGTEIEKIYFKKDAIAFQRGQSIGQAGSSQSIFITDMVLKNYMQGGTNRGLADLYVTINSRDQKSYVKKFSIGVVVKNGLVTGCVINSEPSYACVGYWTSCSKECSGGTQSYIVTSFEKNGGDACPHQNNEIRECGSDSCAQWVSSDWSVCIGGKGTWSYGEWGECGSVAIKNITGNWGACDAPCGKTGSRKRTLTCSAMGTQTRSAECNFTQDSGSQTRSVQCRENGINIDESKCKALKPASSQACAPSNVSLCGSKEPTSKSCTPSSENGCLFSSKIETASCAGAACPPPPPPPKQRPPNPPRCQNSHCCVTSCPYITNPNGSIQRDPRCISGCMRRFF